MPWIIKEQKIGRAGSERQRAGKQREWDRKYGEDEWAIGYIIEGEFLLQTDAVETVYNESYAQHFEQNPEHLKTLIALACELRNPHAEATTGVDLQVPAISAYLEDHNLELQGTEVVDIGSWNGTASHPISIQLSPLHIKCWLKDKWTLEKYWQEKKVLAVWED